MQRLHPLITVFLFLAIFSPLFAADNAFDALESELEEEATWLQKENTIFSATKTIENIDKVPASVTVITEQDLKNLGAQNIYDALRNVPGLGIFMHRVGYIQTEARGFKTDNTEKILFLLNEHPLNEPFSGGINNFYLQPSVDMIKRIEIVRGPSSALFGTNAFLAVINIFTKEAQDINGVKANISFGEFSTIKGNVQYGKQFSNFDIACNVNYRKSLGWEPNIPNTAGNVAATAKTGAEFTELDTILGFNDFKLSAKYSKANADGLLGLYNYAYNDNHIDNYTYTLNLTHELNLGKDTTLKTSLWYDQSAFSNKWETYYAALSKVIKLRSDITSAKTGIEEQITYNLNKQNTFVSGVSFEEQKQYNPQIFYDFDINNSYATVANLIDYSNNPNLIWTKAVSRTVLAIYGQDIYDLSNKIRFILAGGPVMIAIQILAVLLTPDRNSLQF